MRAASSNGVSANGSSSLCRRSLRTTVGLRRPSISGRAIPARTGVTRWSQYEVRREALLREEGRDPAKRCDGVVTLLPHGDAIDEVPGTKDGIVDVPLLRVGSNEAVGGLDLQPEEFVATAEPHAVGQ